MEPPSPANQHVWVDPHRGAKEQRSRRAIEEPTAAQPIITPRGGAVEPMAAHPPAGDTPVHYPHPVPDDQGRERGTYRRSLGLFGAIAGGLAAIIAVVALVLVLANRSGGAEEGGGESDVPTLGGPPPSDVQLRDSGSGIEITWQDPSNGTVSFMVAMGHPAAELKPITTLGPGQTSYELGGLNPSLNYCFTVIAVYRSDQFATSPQTCTSRASATPR